FNNQIYGLTKGQYSPTSRVGTKAPSTPMGSIDHPINPLALAISAGATFIARVTDTDAKLFQQVLARAHAHRGAVFIEILQNCPVFNDAIWADITDKKSKDDNQVVLEHGKPLIFADGKRGIRMRADFRPEVVELGDGKVPESELVVHDELASPAYAFMLSQMTYPEFPMAVGVIRTEQKGVYDEMAAQQVASAIETRGKGSLHKLLHSGMTWEVGPNGVKQ
ncbi:MAG TPA: thiamine pyrophosphate-dependent enzyme, partial [Kofleriaceae bacterium]|nr:thiamine pyrophosphate-dependent enzyme [Kofleriaceae bacterium]